MPTTATDWLDNNPADASALEEMMADLGIPFDVFTEMPLSMKQRIAKALSESFSQPYWDAISETTGGDAERFLRQGLREGWSIRDIAGSIRDNFLDPEDPEGSFRYARWRSENIARTEAGGALNAARKAGMDALADELGPQVPMRPTWLSVLGNTTRPEHADLDGVPADENGEWNLAGTMVRWPGDVRLDASQRCSCFPAGTLVSGDFVGAQRAWYEGKLIEVTTKLGARVTLTPNHPVVTSKGLVPAGMLKPGDQVLSHGIQVDRSFGAASVGQELSVFPKDRGLLPLSSDDVDNEPAPVEEVFESLAIVSAVEVRRAGIGDFYGDGEFMKGQVEIVRAHGKLPVDMEPVGLQEISDGRFGSDVPSARLAGHVLRSGAAVKDGRSSRQAFARFPSFPEPFLRGRGSVSCIVPTGSLSVGVAADFDPCLDQSLAEDGPCVASFLREALQRYSKFVAFDDVIEVRDFYSAGHVYDLQSRFGTITAYGLLYTGSPGIVTSNCQCTITLELGVTDADASRLISDYQDRLLEEEDKAFRGNGEKYSPGQPGDSV